MFPSSPYSYLFLLNSPLLATKAIGVDCSLFCVYSPPPAQYRSLVQCNAVEIQLCTAHKETRHLSELQHYDLIEIQLTGKDRGGLRENIYGLIRLQCLKFCPCEQVQTPITIRGATFMFKGPFLSKRRWSYASPDHKTSSATHSTKKKGGAEII